MWSVGVVRNVGGDFWSRPRIERCRGGVRVGWRWTAWSVHLSRNGVTDRQIDLIAKNARLREALKAARTELDLWACGDTAGANTVDTLALIDRALGEQDGGYGG